mmetsp:Transcript_16346/g.15662  ORF Transcript_16346/g.15662 Transcript_16346/m.15662 type:complete len:282 (-) Transcript_16346:174-1019(-)|eukprot:CAMPEP_0119038654 /NCGR_PEP_ID=MMETSP1177-20130426/7702_1 /TAXON_ID=2985 /ORGANISM="Ochromonas sp, Strain CCMP1899" /LENGTH=281 /DNA_ID=CAMNT_0007001513 /DNA_START=207 /DNA_END=1052 /DNA_ORIENTATION=-
MANAPQFERKFHDASEVERKRKIAILTDQYRPLKDHWTGSNVFLHHKDSEYNYRHHLTKLKDIYTTYQSEFLANIDVDPYDGFKGAKKISTKLYGINGIRSTAPFIPTWEKKRESTWDTDVNIDSKREKYKFDPKIKSRSGSTSPGSSSSRPGSRPESPTLENYSPMKGTGAMRSTQKTPKTPIPIGGASSSGSSNNNDDQVWLRFRSPNDMSREDAVMLGLYSMDEEQNESYIRFVHLLAEFDSFELKKILHDLVKDVNALTSLDSYGGTSTSASTSRRK